MVPSEYSSEAPNALRKPGQPRHWHGTRRAPAPGVVEIGRSGYSSPVICVSKEQARALPHALTPPRGVPHGTPQFKMAAMMLSGLSAGSLAAKTALPARSATKARAGQMIQMKPMGASARSVRLSTVASAAPVPGGISSVRYARQCSLTIGIARVTPPPRPRYPATVAEGPLELSAARC